MANPASPLLQDAAGPSGPLSGADFSAVEAALASALAHLAEAALAGVTAAFRAVLTDPRLDGAFIARAATLPSEQELFEAVGAGVDPVLLAAVRAFAVRSLARSLRPELERLAAPPPAGPFSPDFASAARRALSNKAFAYLAALLEPATMTEAAARAASAPDSAWMRQGWRNVLP